MDKKLLAGLLQAFKTGLKDGYSSGDTDGEITAGMTYECEHHQEAWDRGANLGVSIILEKMSKERISRARKR